MASIPSGSRTPKRSQGKLFVHIVMGARIDPETGVQRSRQVIGVFEEAERAEAFEEAFNQSDRKSKNEIIKAFSSRYSLPYISPALKSTFRSPPIPPRQQPRGKVEPSIFVVFSTSMKKETGSRTLKQIIGITQESKQADLIEESFNRLKLKEDGLKLEAFCARYTLPYEAW